MLHFSKAEFADRRKRVCAQMKERELDALLIFAQESMYWLTGYDTFGYCFFQCLILRQDGQAVLLTRSADLRQAQLTSVLEDIEIWRDGHEAKPAETLRALLDRLGLKGAKLGMEYETHGLTAANGKRVESALADFAALVDSSDLIPALRLIKSESEIAHIVKAATNADAALDAAIKTTRAGADEGAILAAMQGAIFEAGGDYAGNEFIIGSGAEALLCRYKSGRRILAQDDQLTLEWAGVFAHYHAAMMRTLIIGKPKPEHESYFEAAREALGAVEEAMRPGNSFGDIFEAHARAFDERGLAQHRLNACGYGLGARFSPSWMDGPMFYEGNPQEVKPDMSLFAHMILMDSASETAFCLGQTYLTTQGAPKALSRHGLDFVIL